jgi:hypothetical protein
MDGVISGIIKSINFDLVIKVSEMKICIGIVIVFLGLISCSRFYLVTKNASIDVALKQKRDWQFLDTNYHLVAHLDNRLVELHGVQYEPTTRTLSGTISEFTGKALDYYDLVMAATNGRATRKISDSYKLTQQVHFYYSHEAPVADSSISFSLDQVSYVDFVELNRKANAGANAVFLVPLGVGGVFGLIFFVFYLNV